MLGSNLVVLLIKRYSIYLLVAGFSHRILLFSSSRFLRRATGPMIGPSPCAVSGCELQLVEREGGQAKGDSSDFPRRRLKTRCISGLGLRASLSPLSSQAPLNPRGSSAPILSQNGIDLSIFEVMVYLKYSC